MKLTPEFIKWASSLKIHPEVLSQAHARLAPHPETTEGRDFYLGFLQVMVPARERYRKSFLGNQTEPIQDRNCRFFLWTGLLTEGALVLIPDDYHWHDWCGSRLKKNEEAIRDDQGRPSKVLPSEYVSILLEVEELVKPGFSPLAYLGMESASSLLYVLFLDELRARDDEANTARIRFTSKANAYIRAATELVIALNKPPL